MPRLYGSGIHPDEESAEGAGECGRSGSSEMLVAAIRQRRAPSGCFSKLKTKDARPNRSDAADPGAPPAEQPDQRLSVADGCCEQELVIFPTGQRKIDRRPA